MHLAAQNGHAQVVDTLIKSGADINATTRVSLYTYELYFDVAACSGLGSACDPEDPGSIPR